MADIGRLRVLTLVDEVGAQGGGESLARQLAIHLDRERFEPFFCASRREPTESFERGRAELREAGIPLLSLQRRSRFDLGAWRRLAVHLRGQRIDVLHSHKFGSNFWAALVSPLARVPVFVAHEHTWSFEGSPLRRFLDRELIARRADAVIAVSAADRDRMHRIEGIPLAKLRFVPNGIAAPARAGAVGDLRAELGIGAGQPVIGAVATLRPQKALDVLVRAAVPLTERFPGLRVLIAGGDVEGGADGPERRRLAALAERLGVGEQVVLLGHRSDVQAVLATLDVAVLSSDYEGSPLAAMEYMEAGKPVVATRVGGVPDLVEDGATGILVEPQAPRALAAAVAELLADPPRAAAMGRAGRERRRSEFSIERTARRVGALYEELYEASGPGSRR